MTVDDVQSRVLAFSGGGEIDQMRMASILNRRLPEQWLRQIRQHGVIERLLTDDDVIHVELGEAQPRRVIAIRLGNSVIGSIWLAGDDLSADAETAKRPRSKWGERSGSRLRVARKSTIGSVFASSAASPDSRPRPEAPTRPNGTAPGAPGDSTAGQGTVFVPLIKAAAVASRFA